MGVFSLPWDREEQIKVCAALQNVGFISFDKNDEVARIEQSLNMYHDLTESEKSFLETLIQEYGSTLEI
ncbi:MAG: hypothetical protein IIA81_02220 [Thaumarchaeota archaeon]|nr:hypothetical protein [Nitrososphaerota archaeon]